MTRPASSALALRGAAQQLAAAVARDPALLGPGPARLVREWAREGSLLYHDSPAVWLEFDLSAGVTAPFAFLCLDPACAGTFRAPVGPLPAPQPGRLADLVELGSTLLLGHAPDARALATFRRCVAALPPAGRALHVAATPHRGHSDLRLHFAMLTNHLRGWLTRIEWPGDLDRAAAVLDLIGGEFRQIGVQVSAGDRLRPFLGVEAYVARGPAEFPAWSQTFRALAERGVCDLAKADALLAWWGRETRVLPGAPWSVSVQRQFYLKLVLTPDDLEAKAYLSVHPRYTL